MFKKQCKCGTTQKNFKIDIGEFFIAECCEKAGYDEFGKTKEDYDKESEELTNQILAESSETTEETKVKEEPKLEEKTNKSEIKPDEAPEELSYDLVMNNITNMTSKEIVKYFNYIGIKCSKRDTREKLKKRVEIFFRSK